MRVSKCLAAGLLALLTIPAALAAGADPAAPPAVSHPVDAHPVEPRPIEPRLTVERGGPGAPRVALTFDACDGGADQRILDVLVENRIPATFFVTAIWIRRNPAALAVLKAHPDLYAIENHGARHVPAIDRPATVYGLKAAGSPEAVRAEVEGGSRAIEAATGRRPEWYRGAGAVYTPATIAAIRAMGFRIAGYSLSVEAGSRLDAPKAAERLARARDGDVVLAHANHPAWPTGAGIAAGILALQEAGFQFVGLEEPSQRETGQRGR